MFQRCSISSLASTSGRETAGSAGMICFTIELHRAECEFLTGELAAAEKRLTMLASRAANTVERATVECLRIDLYAALDQADRAVAVLSRLPPTSGHRLVASSDR